MIKSLYQSLNNRERNAALLSSVNNFFFSSSGYIVDDHYMLGNGRVLDWLLLITVVLVLGYSIKVYFSVSVPCLCF